MEVVYVYKFGVSRLQAISNVLYTKMELSQVSQVACACLCQYLSLIQLVEKGHSAYVGVGTAAAPHGRVTTSNLTPR